MPTFFVPHADSPEQAERVWQAVHQHLSTEMGAMTDRRIFSVSFRDKGRPVTAIVGETFPLNGEPVIAILESATTSLYFVCTPSRGVATGGPWFVGKDDAYAQDFDALNKESGS